MATKMADKMFGNSPKLGRDDEDGKVKVKKSDKSEDKEAVTEGGAESEGVDMESRHSMDRAEMHMKHQREHMMHKGGSKKEMHARHEDEHEAMHKRHEKEMGKGEEKK